MTNNSSLRYRSDIDGLRAFAILAVVIFHAFPNLLRGGFVGVDAFFVVSGYLITQIILKSFETNSFSFLNFYKRRIKRIFPALLVVLSSVLAAAWWVLLADEFKHLGKHVLASTAFLTNFVLWSEVDYFDIDSKLKPLLHLWSLSVEEQFYLLFPFIMWATYRWGNRRFSFVILFLFLSSFAANIYYIVPGFSENYFLPQTRFWEIMAGALLATWGPKAAKDSNSLALVGMFLLSFSSCYLSSKFAFPAWWGLLPVFGTGMLILTENSQINRRILSHPLLVYVGLISYPLYLWHWVLLSFLRITTEANAVSVCLTVACSFLLAVMTYEWMEKPIRKRRSEIVKPSIFIVAMVVVGSFGYSIYYFDGYNQRFSEGIRVISGFKYDFKSDARSEICWIGSLEKPDAYANECVDQGNGPLVFLWGDSHAARFYPGLKALQKNKQFRIAQFTRDSCPPFMDVESDSCRAANEYVLGKIKKAKPLAVILFADWYHYEFDEKKLRVTLELLQRSMTKQVIVVGPAPQWHPDLPRNLVQNFRFSESFPQRTKTGVIEEISEVDSRLQSYAKFKNVLYVSAFKSMCNVEGCLTRTSNDPKSLTTWDYGHLTTTGAEYLASFVRPFL